MDMLDSNVAERRKAIRRKTRKFIEKWLGMYTEPHKPEALENVRHMLRQVADAARTYTSSGVEPDTSRWSDDQCTLWVLVKSYHDCRKRPRS